MEETREQKPSACTVSQAMSIAKRGLEQITLTVVGEVSELSQKRGYKAIYFTVRDDESAMPCIMWRSVFDKCGMELNVGDLVQLKGNFSCYPARGTLQFSVRKIENAGEGNLRVKVAALAKKLQAEGLMDPARKRHIPLLPKRIAVITSPNGKAVRDVMRTLRRRYPLGEVLFYGVLVEGETAPAQMVEALRQAQLTQPAPDVILLVRGGGSYEALMPYNDEGLARAIAASTIPVVTGIGHEPDNSIADMVADLRCSTPTAAAEKVSLSIDELQSKVCNATQALDNAYSQRINALRHRIGRLEDRPLWRDPAVLIGNHAQAIDLMQERLSHALPASLQKDRTQLQLLEQRFGQSMPQLMLQYKRGIQDAQRSLGQALPQMLNAQRQKLKTKQQSLLHAGGMLTQEHGKQVALTAAQLDALSPLKTLSRGYSIAYAQDEQSIVKSVSSVHKGDNVTIRIQDGSIGCTVNSVESNN